MKFGMMRWNFDPLNPMPVSPVDRARKFSAVFGTTSANNSKTIFPSGLPPILISKNTFGFSAAIESARVNGRDSDIGCILRLIAQANIVRANEMYNNTVREAISGMARTGRMCDAT